MNRRHGRIWGFVCLIFCLISFSSLIFSAGKKLIVVADKAQIYLEPDQKSRVIETLNKGDILTLSSERKFRRIFNYVYFTSQNTGCTKSGYILESLVDKLFSVTKVITIQGDSTKNTKIIRSKVFLDATEWGMSSNQLKRIEGQPAHLGESQGYQIIGYQKEILERDCLIGFYFSNDRLKGAKLSFLEQHTNKNQNIADFKRIKDLMVQKYGRPIEDKISWEDVTHKENISEWGNAIGMGHLEYVSRWSTRKTEVLLRLFGGEDEISLEVTYKPTL
ncbi:MAG: hypothetical protein GQ545_00925 [Candidatus Aminicenantes bacterium]|nr:hypothetical protein [Candidatus Aminicenantes bacterium]